MQTTELTRDLILEKIKNFLQKDFFRTEEISEQSILNDGLALTNLEILELVMECEKEFDISIKDEDIARLATVGNLIDVILKG